MILYRKKLVNRPKPIKGTLKICNWKTSSKCKEYETHIINGGWSKYDSEKYLLIVSVYASSLIKGRCFITVSFVRKKIMNKNTSKWVWLYALLFIFSLRLPSKNRCKRKIPNSAEASTNEAWNKPIRWKTENVSGDSDICKRS